MLKTKLLIVDDERTQREMLRSILEMQGFQVFAAADGHEALNILDKHRADIVISDLKMPQMSGLELFARIREKHPEIIFMIMTGHGTIENAVEAVKQGIYTYITKPIDTDDLIHHIQLAHQAYNLKRENVALKQEVSAVRASKEIVGSSKEMKTLMEQVAMVAKSDATILIRGESGTGKELIANAIHFNSNRHDGPFVKVNCGAIPETLLEDELFGHEKGAFTTALNRRRGRFELAHKGTIFLDEIGDMAPQLQVKILRVLQEREFERIGGSEIITVDVRLIAATHTNLEEMVREGKFREDLYYRINVVPLEIPPIRKRRDDILLLANYFLEMYSAKNNRKFKGLTRKAQETMLQYAWPGNVREIENTIERAVVMGQGEYIDESDLLLTLKGVHLNAQAVFDKLLDENIPLETVEKELLSRSLDRANGNRSLAARNLGLSRRTLQYRAEKYNLLLPSEGKEDEEEPEEAEAR
jgi:two-component system response regulator HydG